MHTSDNAKPKSYKNISYRSRLFARKIISLSLRGSRVFCPICNIGFRMFLPGGPHRRPGALCPECHSLERHRLLWLTLQKLWRKKKISHRGRMLHIAPEFCLQTRFQSAFHYASADIEGTQSGIAMDITAIAFPRNIFDCVVCNHVLEHVCDDRKAMAELYRILKPGGWGSLQVPIKGTKTLEDPSIKDPLERLRLYGQKDHVRQYGSDFVERLESIGFIVQIIPKRDIVKSTNLAYFAIAKTRDIILVSKP